MKIMLLLSLFLIFFSTNVTFVRSEAVLASKNGSFGNIHRTGEASHLISDLVERVSIAQTIRAQSPNNGIFKNLLDLPFSLTVPELLRDSRATLGSLTELVSTVSSKCPNGVCFDEARMRSGLELFELIENWNVSRTEAILSDDEMWSRPALFTKCFNNLTSSDFIQQPNELLSSLEVENFKKNPQFAISNLRKISAVRAFFECARSAAGIGPLVQMVDRMASMQTRLPETQNLAAELKSMHSTANSLQSVLSEETAPAIDVQFDQLSQMLINFVKPSEGLIDKLMTSFGKSQFGRRQAGAAKVLKELLKPTIDLESNLKPIHRRFKEHAEIGEIVSSMRVIRNRLDEANIAVDAMNELQNLESCLGDPTPDATIGNTYRILASIDSIATKFLSKSSAGDALFDKLSFVDTLLVALETTDLNSFFQTFNPEKLIDKLETSSVELKTFMSDFPTPIPTSDASAIESAKDQWQGWLSPFKKLSKCSENDGKQKLQRVLYGSSKSLSQLRSQDADVHKVTEAFKSFHVFLDESQKLKIEGPTKKVDVTMPNLENAKKVSTDLEGGVEVVLRLAEVFEKRDSIRKLMAVESQIDAEVAKLTDAEQKSAIRTVWNTATKNSLRALPDDIEKLDDKLAIRPRNISDLARVFRIVLSFDLPSIDIRKLARVLRRVPIPEIQDHLETLRTLDLSFASAEDRLTMAIQSIHPINTFFGSLYHTPQATTQVPASGFWITLIVILISSFFCFSILGLAYWKKNWLKGFWSKKSRNDVETKKNRSSRREASRKKAIKAARKQIKEELKRSTITKTGDSTVLRLPDPPLSDRRTRYEDEQETQRMEEPPVNVGQKKRNRRPMSTGLAMSPPKKVKVRELSAEQQKSIKYVLQKRQDDLTNQIVREDVADPVPAELRYYTEQMIDSILPPPVRVLPENYVAPPWKFLGVVKEYVFGKSTDVIVKTKDSSEKKTQSVTTSARSTQSSKTEGRTTRTATSGGVSESYHSSDCSSSSESDSDSSWSDVEIDWIEDDSSQCSDSDSDTEQDFEKSFLGPAANVSIPRSNAGAEVAATSTNKYFPEPVSQNGKVRLSYLIASMLCPEFIRADPFRTEKNPDEFPMSLSDIRAVLDLAKQHFSQQPAVLKITVSKSLNVLGDIHGQFGDLARVLNMRLENGQYLFLGDYVDRGTRSLETVLLLFSLAVRFPNKFFLLRGNHETSNINAKYGFRAEVERNFGVENGRRIWKEVNAVFDHLPVVAIVDQAMICMHGGISEAMLEGKAVFEKLTKVPKCEEVWQLLKDILWADPDNHVDLDNRNRPIFSRSGRMTTAHTFNEAATSKVLAANKLQLVIRGHEVQEHGFSFMHDEKVLTLYGCAEDNAACWATINEQLQMTVSRWISCDDTPHLPDEKTVGE